MIRMILIEPRDEAHALLMIAALKAWTDTGFIGGAEDGDGDGYGNGYGDGDDGGGWGHGPGYGDGRGDGWGGGYGNSRGGGGWDGGSGGAKLSEAEVIAALHGVG